MKKYVIILATLFIFSLQIYAQDSEKKFPLLPKVVIEASNCVVKFAEIRAFLQNNDRDNLTIIVSHLGKDEKSEFGKRRLYNAKSYITSSWLKSDFRRQPESVLIVEGEKTERQGYLDFYMKEEIKLRILFNKNEDLSFGPCVLNYPYEKFCETEFEKLFYPCKKK